MHLSLSYVPRRSCEVLLFSYLKLLVWPYIARFELKILHAIKVLSCFTYFCSPLLAFYLMVGNRYRELYCDNKVKDYTEAERYYERASYFSNNSGHPHNQVSA